MRTFAFFLVASVILAGIASAYETSLNIEFWQHNRSALHISEAAVLSDGGQRGVTAFNNHVEFYDARNGTVLWTKSINARDISISKDGSRIAILDSYSNLNMYDSNSRTLWTYSLPSNVAAAKIDITDDGSTVAIAMNFYTVGIAGISGKVIAIEGSTGEVLWERFSVQNYIYIHKVEITEDGGKVLVQTPSAVFVHDKNSVLFSAMLAYNCCVDVGADISGDGRYIAIGDLTAAGLVELWEFNGISYLPKWTALSGRDSVRYVALSEDGSTLVVGANNKEIDGVYVNYDDGLVLTYSTSSPVPLWTYSNYGEQGKINWIDLSQNGQRIIVGVWGSEDLNGDVLTLFDRGGNRLIRFKDDSDNLGAVYRAEISDDGGNIFATGSTAHPYQTVSDGKVIGIKIL